MYKRQGLEDELPELLQQPIGTQRRAFRLKFTHGGFCLLYTSSLDALVAHMEKDAVDPASQTVFISHGDCRADAEYVADLVREKRCV